MFWAYDSFRQSSAFVKNDHLCEDFIKWAAERLDKLPGDLPVVITNRYAANVFGANEEGMTSKPGVYFSVPHDERDGRIWRNFRMQS